MEAGAAPPERRPRTPQRSQRRQTPRPARRGDPRGEPRLASHVKVTLRGLYDIDCSIVAGAYLAELAKNLQDTDCPSELICLDCVPCQVSCSLFRVSV